MSEKGAIKKSTAQAICDAIKTKEGSIDPIPFNEVANRITALPTASGDSKFKDYINGTLYEVTADDLQGVTVLREKLFYSAGLKKITIPNTVTEFSINVFGTTLEETRYEGTLKKWCKIKRYVFDYTKYGKLYIDGEIIKDIDVDEAFVFQANSFGTDNELRTIKLRNASVRYVLYDYAFRDSLSLTKVEIESYKLDYTEGNSTEYHRLRDVFMGCKNLTDIYVSWNEGDVSGAPWGATNATIHYNIPVPFYIDDKEYFTNLKMTWAEWCDSEYNTSGFYIDENDSNYVKNADGLRVNRLHSNGTYIAPTSKKVVVSNEYKYYSRA